MHNITGLQNSTTIGQLVYWANGLVDGLIAQGLLFAIFIVLILGFMRYGFDKAILTSSVICFILGIFLRYAGLIDFFFVILFGTIAGFTLGYMLIVGDK